MRARTSTKLARTRLATRARGGHRRVRFSAASSNAGGTGTCVRIARPLGRVIQEYVKKPLAEELLFGALVKGGSVKVGMKDGALAFEYLEAAAPALPKPEEGDGEAEKEPETIE